MLSLKPFRMILSAAIFIFFLNQSLVASTTYNVLNFGAKPDGETDSTAALSGAWSAACCCTKHSMIYIPRGRFLVKRMNFKGPCRNKAIVIRIDGTLVAPADYRVMGGTGSWLLFRQVDGVSIQGGVLDAKGGGLWACKKSGSYFCPNGATTLEVTDSANVEIAGLSSWNSQMFHIVIDKCQNVKLQGLSVFAAGNSPNTDGIHVQLSSHVTILRSRISTGDDCISIGPGTSGLWIEGIFCGPGHGISIGSLGRTFYEEGVQNVTVKSVTFENTTNGLRIKTWGRRSKGYVKNVVFQQARMIDVKNPIIIDQNYCPWNKNCPGQESGVKISGVRYEDIQGTSASEVAVKFDCSKKWPCKIDLENVNLNYQNKGAKALCSYAAGTTVGWMRPTISCLD